MSWEDDESFTDRIYEASVLPEFWPGVLRDFAAAAGCKEGVLLLVREDAARWVASSPLVDELIRGHYAYPGAV